MPESPFTPSLALVGPLPWAERVRVAGEDAHAFLQSQLAADLGRGSPKALAWSLRLDASGHVQGAAWVLGPEPGGDGSWLLLVEAGEPGALRAGLEAFVVADDVVLADASAGHARLLVGGPGAATWWAAARGGAGASGPARLAGAVVGFASRSFPGGVELDGPAAALENLAAALVAGHGAARSDALPHAARVAAGIPLVPVDLGPSDLPQEGGLLAEDGYGLRKGCYLGQEVMARLAAQGRVRRGLHRVRCDGAAVPGARVLAGDVPVGELRSVVDAPAGGGRIALAMLKDKAFAPGAGPLVLDGARVPVIVLGRVGEIAREAAP